MGNDGDKTGTQDQTGAEPQGAPEGAVAPGAEEAAAAAAQDAVAAAEAAAKAAEQARRKADELAKQAAAAREAAAKQASAPEAESEQPDLSVGGGEPPLPPIPPGVPGAPAVASASWDEERGVVDIDPNAQGLFGTDTIDEAAAEGFQPEIPYMRDKRHLSAIISLIVALALIIAGVIFLASDTEASARMKWFLAGTSCVMDAKTKEPILPEAPEPPGNLNCLQLHVEQHKRALEAKWRQEDFRSRHIYGTVTLTYFPQDAQVHVWQTKYVQDGKAWARNEAGPGDVVCDDTYLRTPAKDVLSSALKHKAGKGQLCERPLKNKTETLAENQFIERLPLKHLPVFETDKCTEQFEGWDPAKGYCTYDGKDYRKGTLVSAYEYHYRVVITREGYEPREFIWTRRDWIRAPGAYIMNWPGADLIPKPETFRANFVQAHCEIFCYQQIHDVSFTNIPEDNLDMIFKRSGFKSDEDFKNAEGALTRGEFKLWWEERYKAISLLADRMDAYNKEIAQDNLSKSKADKEPALVCKDGKRNDPRLCAAAVCEWRGGRVCRDIAAESVPQQGDGPGGAQPAKP